MISNLPPLILEKILCLVPIQEAARTSILAREWKYKWTKIPKLEFTEDTVKASPDEKLSVNSQLKYKLFHAINQVLSMHQGPIHEFTLTMYLHGSCVEIDQIIKHLSRNNNVKKLTLSMCGLPSSLFSLHKLTDLCLRFGELNLEPPPFNVFSSLTSLCVEHVFITKKILIHILSSCPLLHTVILNLYIVGKMFDNYTITELFEYLPVIENLSIGLKLIERFLQNGMPNELSTALVRLKYLWIEDMCFIQQYALHFLALLLKSSPNLERLKLQIFHNLCLKQSEIDSATLGDYSDIWFEHLNELEIENMSDWRTELDFVKLILVKSPVLKKLRLILYKLIAEEEELQVLRILLRSPRASSVVEVIVESGVGF